MRRTPAKVNLYLVVGEVRPEDGRHKIQTVFYPHWGLWDEVSVERGASGEGLLLTTSGRPIPGGDSVEKNLACRAVSLYCQRFGLVEDYRITLYKRIPVGGGLGGGSSDAAAALEEINELERKATQQELHDIAAELGADVPFFLNPVMSLGTGIGDILTPIENPPDLRILGIYPGFESPVAWAYANWKRPAGVVPPACPLGGQADWSAVLWNDLGFAVAEKYPKIQDALRALRGNGAKNAIVSGSGSSVFGIFETEEEYLMAKNNLAKDWEIL